MGDAEEFAKSVVAGTVSETTAKVLDSEIVRSLLGPAATEIGDFLGDLSSAVRFYATDNMGRICVRWYKFRKQRPISPEETKRVMPLLPLAAMVSDEELQERWARLLQSVAVGLPGVLPSFGQTLSQLTPEEARYLDELWKQATYVNWTAPKDYLRSMYMSSRFGPIDGADQSQFLSRDRQLSDDFATLLSDLVRLGVLEANPKPNKTGNTLYSDLAELLDQTIKDIYEQEISFSAYGKRFMVAISEPE